jgi:hypothetical protein
MLEVFQFVAIATCMLFAGAAVYVNLVEHPARLGCSTAVAATVFVSSYKRAVPVQVSLAVIAAVSGIGVWALSKNPMWLLGATLIISVIPFTLFFIMPTNKKLLAPAIDKAAQSTRQLLLLWGKLHAARSILSLAASFLYVWLAIKS